MGWVGWVGRGGLGEGVRDGGGVGGRGGSEMLFSCSSDKRRLVGWSAGGWGAAKERQEEQLMRLTWIGVGRVELARGRFTFVLVWRRGAEEGCRRRGRMKGVGDGVKTPRAMFSTLARAPRRASTRARARTFGDGAPRHSQASRASARVRGWLCRVPLLVGGGGGACAG